MSDASGITAAANVAIFVSGIIIPILLLILIGALARWAITKQQESKTVAALLVGGPAVASALAFLLVDLLWLTSIIKAYPSQATVTGTQLAYIDNTWWSQHYGEGYTIGDDQYIENFCVPYHQFAVAELSVQCPLRTCQAEILVWDDCQSRDVCREDCQALVDDGQEQIQCASNDDDGNDDGNGNDDNWQWTETEVLECAQNTFATGTVLSSVTIDDGSLVPWMVTDCTSCLSLSRKDYEWVLDQEDFGISTRWRNRHRGGQFVESLLGLALAAMAVIFYRQTLGGTTLPAFLEYDDDDDDDPEEWKDENEFHRVEE